MILNAALAAGQAPSATAAAATVPGSAGCVASKSVKTGKFTETGSDGVHNNRTYLAQVPTTYKSTTPYPITFVFHQVGGTSQDAYNWGLQGAAGAAQGGIFVYPQAVAYIDKSGINRGVGWYDQDGGIDMHLVDSILASMAATYCLDTSRIFAAGFSWGCDFVTALAVARGVTFRAIAASSCSDEFANSEDYKTYTNLPSPGAAHPAIRFTHQAVADPQYPAPYFATTLKLYQFLNAAAATSVPEGPPPCVSYAPAKSPLIECAYTNIGHHLPPNWNRDTWAFFNRFQ